MQPIALIIVLCVYLVFAPTQAQFEENNGTAVVVHESDCGVLGSLSGVYCVTEVSFKLNLLDSTIYSCSTGTVCANLPLICVSGEPACQHNSGCDFCSQNATSTCVAQTQYAACTDGVPDANAEFCPESTPYCSMPSDKHGVPFVQCSSVIKSIACEETLSSNTTTTEPPTPEPPTPEPPTPEPPTPEPPTPDPSTPEPPSPDPPTPEPPTLEPPSPDPPIPSPTNETEFVCPSFGKFADPFDTTYKAYYYCYYQNDMINAMQFICPANTVFSREKQKCVIRISFE